MANRIQIRRDSAADWAAANPVLADGEMGWEINASRFKIGDGVTPYNDLDYYSTYNVWVSEVTASIAAAAAAVADAGEEQVELATIQATLAANQAIQAAAYVAEAQDYAEDAATAQLAAEAARDQAQGYVASSDSQVATFINNISSLTYAAIDSKMASWLDTAFVIAPKFGSSTPGSYPQGMTTMAVTTAQSFWPATQSANVITWRQFANAFQIYYGASDTVIYIRKAVTGNDTWRPWTKIITDANSVSDLAVPAVDTSWNSKKITNLATPVSGTDAANKSYVDGVVGGVAPTGVIQMFAGTTPPTGWVFCDGASLLRAGTYAALFGVIGTAYGAADATHFNVPDMRGRTPIGATSGTLPDGISARALGDKVGTETHVLSINELPNHDHFGSTGSAGSHSHSGSTGGAGSHDHGAATGAAGGGAYIFRPTAYHFDGVTHFGLTAGASSFQDRVAVADVGYPGYPDHSHVIAGVGNHAHAISADGTHAHVIPGQGGGLGHNNMQPSTTVNFIIKY